MLNIIYYPVSAILWFWHKVFGYVLGADNGFAWVLSVIFLVFTLRALLFKPFVSQVRSMRKMQEFQPQIKKLQEKYKGDRTKLAEEMQKLQKEHGVNPVGGCLPVLVQLAGLHRPVPRAARVPHRTTPTTTSSRSGVCPSTTPNAVRGQAVRRDHGDRSRRALLARTSATSASSPPGRAPVDDRRRRSRPTSPRASRRRTRAPASAATRRPRSSRSSTMWVFPLGLLVFGAFFPIAILLYWLANNSWTLGQQYFVYGKIDEGGGGARPQAASQRDLLAPEARPEAEARRGRGPGDRRRSRRTPVTRRRARPEDAVSRPRCRRPAPDEARPGAPGPTSGKGSGRAAPGKVGSAANGQDAARTARARVGWPASSRPGKKAKKRR